MTKKTIQNIVTAVGGILLFKSITYVPWVEGFLREHYFIGIIIAFLIFYKGADMIEKVWK